LSFIDHVIIALVITAFGNHFCNAVAVEIDSIDETPARVVFFVAFVVPA